MKKLLKNKTVKKFLKLKIARWLIKTIYSSRLLHFFAISGTGFILNLIITLGLTEFALGRDRYLIAYVMGIAVNICYNFLMHRKYTFKVKDEVAKRFSKFILTNLIVATTNVILVTQIVRILGNKWYWVVIIVITGILFIANFLISKYNIFKKK